MGSPQSGNPRGRCASHAVGPIPGGGVGPLKAYLEPHLFPAPTPPPPPGGEILRELAAEPVKCQFAIWAHGRDEC